MQKHVSFKNKRGLTLRGVIGGPVDSKMAVIILHGYPSSVNGSTPRRLFHALKKKYLVLRFSFTGSPPSDGKFEDKLMSKDVQDTRCAVDFIEKNFPGKKIVLIGHSTGAIEGALYANTDKRLWKVVLTGVVGNLSEAARYDFTDPQVRDFWTKGYVEYNRPGKFWHKKRIKKAFYDEFFKLDTLDAIHKLKRPLLIVHGEEDEAIPSYKDPHVLYKAARKPKKLVIVRGADHGFHGKKQFKELISSINSFIGR